MTTQGYVVTGGTGGLGSVVVRHLLSAGARVAVPYRHAGPWEALTAATGRSPSLWGDKADMADPEPARQFMNAAAVWLGRLDGVAALAGAYRGSGPLEKAPDAEWDEMIHANLAATYATCRAALPHLLKAGGVIVTVASRTAALGEGAGAAAYTAAKAGVIALTRTLALENRDRGVRVNAVAPGIIDTPDNRRAMPDADHATWVPPAQIASVVAFLLSPESAPVSGAVVPAYGRS